MFQNNKYSTSLYRFSAQPTGSHRQIIDLVGHNKKVMDVGCNKGYLSYEFKKNGCYVLGIESDRESGEIAKNVCDSVIIVDVEKIKQLPFPEHYFDTIVFADVLEHCKNPDEVLVRFKKYLHSQGFIIASLPNIARLDIRLKFLLGKFDYEEGGILDRTHLRFFTLASAQRLFKDSGYKVTNMYYTGIASKMKFFPSLFAFQFIIIAEAIE